MKNLLLIGGVAIGSAVLLGQINAPAPHVTVPAHAIITVEAQHDHEATVPRLKLGEVVAYKGEKSFPVKDVVPLEGANGGLELFLLIDDYSRATLGTQLEDLRHFVNSQSATTSIGVGYMRNATTNVVQNLTNNHGDAANAIRLPLETFGAMASPYLSLTDLIKRWPENSNRREIVMITSGIDPMGDFGTTNPYLDSAIEIAQRHGIIIYAIYTPTIGHARHSFWRLNWAQNHLAQLGDETGGEAYMLGFGPPVSIKPYLDEITAHLANQYRVTIELEPEDQGGLREVRFATQVPNADVTAPSAVYVPAAHEQTGE